MSKQYTVITKDGSKWLRPVNPFDPRDIMWQEFNLKEPDLLYLGNHPEGTVLSEEQVKPRRQVLYNGEWQQFKRPIPNGNYETRTIYTDAESHGRHISNEVHPVLAWLRTNGEISKDGKYVTYSCEEIEAFFNRPNWMRFKEV